MLTGSHTRVERIVGETASSSWQNERREFLRGRGRDSIVFTLNAARDFFNRTRIQIRISLGIGVAIALGMVLIGAISVHQHEAKLRQQTNVLGTNVVQTLVDVARDNILLNSVPIIQETTAKFAKRDIPGLEEISVMNRYGVIIAHSIIDSVYRNAPADVWNTVHETDLLEEVETETHFIYVEPIFVQIHSEPQMEKVFLGAAWLRFSKESIFASIDEVKGTILFVSASVFVVAVPLIFLLAGKFLQIGIVLSNAARLVGMKKAKGGMFSSTTDIVGLLTTELDLMVRQIHEKMTMEKFVSQATIQMVAKGKVLPAGGTRKFVAILFSDVRNFSSLAERLLPEEIVEMLNQYLNLQTRVIHLHHGFVDKFMGDGIMSIFPDDQMAYSAVSAAIALQREISCMNKKRKDRGEIALSVGIGIAAGEVVLGSIGSGERMDYTAIGDTVNLASHLCSVAGADEILVSESVVLHLNGKGKSLVNPEVKMSIKGKRDPVSVYQIQYSSENVLEFVNEGIHSS